ncbi:31566_t:CDS:2 [Gigaspora margarita]|uniref:31566_t:CDS:1 n=1 Tax=Gigaspora margarita TaxID=4874 RepID=A0ABN7W4S9_GIGMA|nr:31566_t:CDS:2 [Gigaspora margarita]
MLSVSNYDECIEESSEDSDVTDLLVASVKSKPPKIEILYSFLNLQSFDGSFLPSHIFILENIVFSVSTTYLEIIIFETFKEESEMHYGKAKKNIKKEVASDEQKKVNKKIKNELKMIKNELKMIKNELKM